uniref:Uncharacterized protein n=1 Tax=Anguilla anguilla TaxID=7936 RepID=A0A0E9SUZ8_ANGAN
MFSALGRRRAGQGTCICLHFLPSHVVDCYLSLISPG